MSGAFVGWAVQRRDGSIVVELGADIDEARAWQVALGWPSAEEVEWAKRHGARAFRCEVVERPYADDESSD